MNKNVRPMLLFLLIVLLLVIAAPAAAAPDASSAASLNARFVQWDRKAEVIHIFVFNDAGRPGQPPAIVEEGQKVLMGFEWGGATLEELEDTYYNNPNHDLTVSVDGGPEMSVISGYQAPYMAATRSGPAWSWDHDGDGPGDRNGNGIGDWSGPTMFFRYEFSGLSVGWHTFEFTVYDNGSSFSEVITVLVVPG